MRDHPWIDRREYPFASRFLDVDGGRMHYVDEGGGDPVVMVHGNPTWSFLYRRLISRLSPTRRCVAPDHLGFGLSGKPAGWSYHPADHARNLARLIETLDLRDVTLVVQDWGGPIGLSYALHRPENVRRLVIMNTWCWPVRRDPYYLAFSTIAGGIVGRFMIRRFDFLARVFMRRAFGDASKLSPRAHQHYLRPLAKPSDRQGSWVFPRQIVGASPWLDDLWKRRSVLRGIPTLIVWGMQDVAFRRSELERWVATLPHAEVVGLPTVGHFVPEEAPAELNKNVERFLAGAA